MTAPELTTRQRFRLRGLARNAKVDVTIGKAGVTEGVIRHIATRLAAQELVKIRLPEGRDRKAVAAELAESLDATLVDVVGRMVVLYRPSLDLPSDKRVRPPGE